MPSWKACRACSDEAARQVQPGRAQSVKADAELRVG